MLDYLSLMMALSERYANAWHMLIERQYLIHRDYVYWSGVQVSKGYYRYLGVRQNKSLIRTIYYSCIDTKSNDNQGYVHSFEIG